jgi:hypothetical protein
MQTIPEIVQSTLDSIHSELRKQTKLNPSAGSFFMCKTAELHGRGLSHAVYRRLEFRDVTIVHDDARGQLSIRAQATKI